MPYNNSVTAIDMAGGISAVRITIGFAWKTAGAPEQTMDEINVEVPAGTLATSEHVISYQGNLAPPQGTMYIALWARETNRPAPGGWLFRSGGFLTDLPTSPLEIILAPEQLVDIATINKAIGPLPQSSGTTTITNITSEIIDTHVSLTAIGTDTRLAAGTTFTFTGIVTIFPNDSVLDVDEPFTVNLTAPAIRFSNPGGTSFATVMLNSMSGLILADTLPRIRQQLKTRIISGVLEMVSSLLAGQQMSTLPPGVILSIRNIRAITSSSEPTIGVLAAVGAFGGVMNKFPPLPPVPVGSPRTCFIATAAAGPNSAEVKILRDWRDRWLKMKPGGRFVIAFYEFVSPPIARAIDKSQLGRKIIRKTLIAPAASIAARMLRSSSHWRG